MVRMIKEHTDEYNVLVRMFRCGSKVHVQAIDNDCGERIESIVCNTMDQAEKNYSRYLNGSGEPVLLPV